LLRAVELARKAVELSPKTGMYWNTLGTVLYRAGDWRGAIEALSESNELDAERTLGFNAYFLAMAHHRLGKIGPARTWFDVAERWHGRSAPADAELKQFRAEAAKLLGLDAESHRENTRRPADDETLARLILQADPSADWARTWLGDAAMPDGPEAFARP
jgi:hypothetical protein